LAMGYWQWVFSLPSHTFLPSYFLLFKLPGFDPKPIASYLLPIA